MAWRLAASVLSADFTRLGEQARALQSTGLVDRIQVDVMDGMYVPNISFGPLVFEALVRACAIPLEGHLMIEQPGRYYERFCEAGARSLIVHWETCPHLHRDLQAIRALGLRTGVAVNPATPVSFLSEVLPLVDTALVMSVNPGFGGQAFIESALGKVAALRERIDRLGLATEIEVDGGVNRETAPRLLAAGADVLVVGSALIPPDGDVEGAVRRLVDAVGSPPAIAAW